MRWRRRRWLLLSGCIAFAYFFFTSVPPFPDHAPTTSPTPNTPRVYDEGPIPEGCACLDVANKEQYNFCYRLPGREARGRRFDCSHLDTLLALGLLNRTGFLELDREPLPEPVFVTGSSDNHFTEQLRLIQTIQTQFPDAQIYLYDLGLSEGNAAKMTLLEFGAVWWMDSSVVFKKGNLSHVYALLQCRNASAIPSLLDLAPAEQVNLPPPPHDNLWIEDSWHIPEWAHSVRTCHKFSYMLQGFTGHGIYPATHPGVYEFLPTDVGRLQQPTAKMYEAGFAFAVRSHEAVADVLKWYVLCALEETCMGPPGAGLGCRFQGTDRYADYAHCHRFDQSVVNLLLANRNEFRHRHYTSTIVDFFNIRRGGAGLEPQHCPGDTET